MRKWLMFAVLMGAAGVARADAVAQLQTFIGEVGAARGQFTQTVQSNDGSAATAQEGSFAFQRPGQFRWEIKQPYEQLVLSDGEHLLQYDPDLAQLTRRRVDEAVGASPAAILFGDGDLSENFVLGLLPDRDGLSWLRAMPRQSDAGFESLEIGLRNNQPAMLLVRDGFGQTTRIVLKQLQPAARIEAGEFAFDPPAGTDVVEM